MKKNTNSQRRRIEYSKLEIQYEVDGKATFHDRIDALAPILEDKIDSALDLGGLDAFNCKYADGIIDAACDSLVSEFKSDCNNLIRINNDNNDALKNRAKAIRSELKALYETLDKLEDEMFKFEVALGKEAI